jgi:hypothetical protein
MRTLLTVCAIGLVSAILSTPRVKSQEGEWEDLFANSLRDWSRSGDGENPWRITTGRTVYCQPGAAEVYIPEREFGDGTLKFEYRFKPTGEKKGYKAGVWARRTLEGSGCRVALGDDCGTLNATFQGASDRLKTLEEKPATNPIKAPGEWNQVRIALNGSTMMVFVNDTEVASFYQCDTARGLVALEAEGVEVEFRNMMWKEGK